jgi:hypothetical protein
VDGRLRSLFEADQRYVRRRRLRRRLQAAAAVSALLPIAVIVWQDRFTAALANVTISAWVALFALTHLVVVSEWVCSRGIVEAANELIDGVRPRSVASRKLFGASLDESNCDRDRPRGGEVI